MPSLVVVADRKILFVHDEAVAHHEWLLFQTMNEGFGTGVMIAIFFGTHTTKQLMFIQQGLLIILTTLRTSITLHNYP